MSTNNFSPYNYIGCYNDIQSNGYGARVFSSPTNAVRQTVNNCYGEAIQNNAAYFAMQDPSGSNSTAQCFYGGDNILYDSMGESSLCSTEDSYGNYLGGVWTNAVYKINKDTQVNDILSGDRRSIMKVTGTVTGINDFSELINGNTNDSVFSPVTTDLLGKYFSFTFSIPIIIQGIKLWAQTDPTWPKNQISYWSVNGISSSSMIPSIISLATNIPINFSTSDPYVTWSFKNNTPFLTYQLIMTSGTVYDNPWFNEFDFSITPLTVNCSVSNWSPWGPCSAQCGGGTQSESRTIITQPQNGGQSCGSLTNTQPCNTQVCPIDCALSSWSTWSPCSEECGGGTQSESRTIITQPQNGGQACGFLTHTQPCNTQVCPLICTSFTPTLIVGNTMYTFTATFNKNLQSIPNIGANFNFQDGPNGNQQKVSNAYIVGNKLSFSCQAWNIPVPNGYFTFNSTINSPTIIISVYNTTLLCTNILPNTPLKIGTSYTFTATFNGNIPVPPVISANFNFTSINGPQTYTNLSGLGTKTISFTCTPTSSVTNGYFTFNNTTNSPATLNINILGSIPPVDCALSSWSSWSPCSTKCGGGSQSESRTIITQSQNGGQPCGSLTQTQPCNTSPCPVDCALSSWSSWSPCSTKCGGGSQSESRTIITQSQNGGQPCGSLTQTQPCNTSPCPVDCALSSWSSWSPCSTKCGGGSQSESRTIITQSQNGGQPCGSLTQTQPCNTSPCPIDCALSSWSSWSPCSEECGGGFQSESRTIVTQPQNSGQPCGSLKNTQPCNTQNCPLKCTSITPTLIVGNTMYPFIATFNQNLQLPPTINANFFFKDGPTGNQQKVSNVSIVGNKLYFSCQVWNNPVPNGYFIFNSTINSPNIIISVNNTSLLCTNISFTTPLKVGTSYTFTATFNGNIPVLPVINANFNFTSNNGPQTYTGLLGLGTKTISFTCTPTSSVTNGYFTFNNTTNSPNTINIS